MATEYKLSYTATDINERLGKINQLSEDVADLQDNINIVQDNVEQVQSNLEQHNISTTAHADIRTEITTATSSLKEELLDGVSTEYNTFKKIGELINNNASDIDQLIDNKQNVITGTEGQIVGFDENGNATAQNSPQSDWNQNNESSPDYIKNKPFGEEEVQEVLIDDIIDWNLNEEDNFEEPHFDAEYISNKHVSFVVGNTYIFESDILLPEGENGPNYSYPMPLIETVCTSANRLEFYNIPIEGGNNTGYLGIEASDEDNILTLWSTWVNSNVKIIHKAGSLIKTIDEKYISDTIARTTYVDEKIASIPTPDVSGQIEVHNASTDAHPDIRAEITSATSALKNELLNGAGEAYDTLKELGNLIDDNQNAIQVLENIATGKQSKITGTPGQFVVIGDDGNVTTKTVPNAESVSF